MKSATVRNGQGSRRHNVRDYKEMPKHIDPELSKNNETLVDIPLWKAYEQIFGDVIREYNEKQTRADRKYEGGSMAYLKSIQAETGEKARKAYYETFVQIGDRKDTGLHDCELERKALRKFMAEFQMRNPNLKVIGAYIHADETNGTLHGHIDWIPVASGYKRGFEIQNGLKRALGEMGFEGKSKKFNAYLGWQESERKALREICKGLGIETKQTKGEGRAWSDKETFIAKEQAKEAKREAVELKRMLLPYQEMKVASDEVGKTGSKLPFGLSIVKTEVLEKVKEQAKGYVINKPKIQELNEWRANINLQQKRADDKDKFLSIKESRLADQELAVQQAYQRQLNLNQLLEQSERDKADLKEENKSLKDEMALQRAEISKLKKIISEKEEIAESAYESLSCVVKAVGMLKYDKDEGYAVPDLSKKQSKLIDVIAEYAAAWAEHDGFPEKAEVMENKIGISKGIRERLEPAKNKGLEIGD